MQKYSLGNLLLPKDRNNFGLPNLPCMVIGNDHYKKSNAIHYRLCSQDAEKWPWPQLDAQSVGFNKDKIKNISMSETQVGEVYSASGRKLSHCQCKKDCLTSKTCKCRKLKKFCGAMCHGGTGNNRFCRTCPPEWKVCHDYTIYMYMWTERNNVNARCDCELNM